MVNLVSFLPRQDRVNGSVRKADLFAKSGAGEWQKVATYSSAGSDRGRQVIPYPAREVRDLKRVITETVGGFGTMAELNVHTESPSRLGGNQNIPIANSG